VKTLDRYLIRETIPPFLLALGLFTFLLAVKPALDQAQQLLSKGVDLFTVGLLILYLLPQALGVTLPMAFTAGLLMALGRLSGDRESVAFLACGVSPVRLLRPILLMAVVVGALDMYTLVRLVPEYNLRFQQETFELLVEQGESDIRPGLFYEGFPGKVLRVRDTLPAGGWRQVMLADTSQPGRRPTVTLAESGYLAIDEERRQVDIVLRGDSVQYRPGAEDGTYNMARMTDLKVSVPASSVFGTGNLGVSRGRAEMTIAQLRETEAEKVSAGISPHPEVMQRHQMFSFPVACVVFALVALALGLHTRREGKLGGFALGVGVIFAYYGIMMVFEALTKGGLFSAHWARWVPNIVIGIAGLLAVRWRNQASGGELALRLPHWVRAVRPRPSPAPRKAERVVIVLRMPDLSAWLPRPRLLDLYIGRKYLSVALLSCGALLGLYYIGTLIDKSERLFKDQASMGMMLEYFYYSTPQFIAYVIPMAALVSALAAMGGLTRTGELTVMRACGVSLYRVAMPVLLLALIWSGGLFLLDDRVLAHANREAEVLEDQIRGNAPHTVNVIANAHWLAGRDNRIYHYTVFDIPAQTLHQLSIFDIETGGDYRLERQTYVTKAVFADEDDVWAVDEGWIQRFPESGGGIEPEALEPGRMSLAPPAHFSGMHNEEADLMTFGELREYIAEQQEAGLAMTRSEMQMQSRIAFPLVTVVMTLLGVPFGVTIGRRGALYGVGAAMILGSAYWLVDTFFMAAGQAEVLPAVLAAWAANLLFLALAAYAILTVRT